MQSPQSAVHDRFKAVPLPGPSTLGGMNLAINRFAKNRATALAFIRFLTSDTTQREIHLRGAYPAAVRSVYEDRQVQAAQPYTPALHDSITGARSRPVTPYYGQVTAEIQGAVHPAIEGGHDPGRALRDLADALEVALRGEIP